MSQPDESPRDESLRGEPPRDQRPRIRLTEKVKAAG